MLLSKITIPFTLAVTLGGAIAGAAVSYAANKTQVAELTRSVHETADRVDRLREQRTDDREQVAEIRTDLKQVVRSLERLESRLGTKP